MAAEAIMMAAQTAAAAAKSIPIYGSAIAAGILLAAQVIVGVMKGQAAGMKGEAKNLRNKANGQRQEAQKKTERKAAVEGDKNTKETEKKQQEDLLAEKVQERKQKQES